MGRRLPPDTAIDDKPAALTNQAHVRITFHALGLADRFACRLDGGALTPCTSPFEADVSDGDHRFEVAAAVDESPDVSPAVAMWTVDTVAPDTAITAAPPALDNSLAPEFAFQGTDNRGAVTFECALDDGAFAACTSPATVAVSDGAHRYSVRAVDAAGNRDPSPATAMWSVDSTAPETVISAGPAASSTTGADVTFAFGSPDAPVTFECALDGGEFAACTSPVSFTLGDGEHTFTVRARDATGQIDPSPVIRTWTVDATAPEVAITERPGDPSNSATATFGFSSTDATATFECAVDAGAFAACTTGFATGSLADGSHTFTVRATDPVGNASSASFTWLIDTVAPTVAITGGPPAATSSTTATFTFTSGGGAVAIACSLDGGAFTACTSPRTITGATDGSHDFTVRATDAAGNTDSDTRSWTVDTTPPVVTITSGPPNPTNDSTPTLEFTVTGATAIDCQVDTAAFAPCSSPFTTSTLSNGSHTVTVRGTDGVGNTATANRTFTVDTVPPVVTVTPVPSPTNDSTPAVVFTVTGATTIQCQVDTGAFAACTSPFTPGSPLADGSHTITVRAADAAGNTDSDSTTFTVDATGPSVGITQVPSPTNDSTPTVAFTVTGATTIQCQIDTGAFAACSSPFTPASPLADGAHTITVRAADDAGNSDSATTSFTVDTAPPVVNVTPVASPTNDSTPSVSFTVTGATTIQCQVDTGAFAACTSPFIPASALADGSHTITVRGTDAAGNVGTGSTTFTVDTAAPVVTVTPVPSPTNDNTPSVSFTVTGATAIQCQVDTGAFATCTSPFTPATLTDGSHTITVRGTDAAGNTGTGSTNFVVDTAAPVVTVTPVPSPTNDSTPNVNFTVTGATTIQCQVDTGVFVMCISPFTPGGALADGSHTITVRGTDAAGNVASGSTTFTVDTAPPVVTVTPVASPTNDSTPSVSFTVTGATTIQCQIDTGAFAACASPFTPAAALADGSHTITVRGTDAAGNVGTGSTTFTVDTAAPVVTVTDVSSPTNDNTPSVSFTVTGATTIQCQVDTGAFATCASPFTPTTLADGSHTITVRGTDAAGNTGSDATTFTVDTAPPVVTVTDVTTPTSDSTPSVSFTVTGATTIQCQVDTGSFATCTSPFTPASALADGSHTITVRGSDAAGNVGSDSTTFTVDTAPPVVTVTDVATPTNDSTPTVSFTVTGATTIQCQIDTGSFATCTSPFTPASALSDASHTITVRGTDAAGNTATDSTTFTVDTTPPPVAFDDTPPAQWPVNYFDMRFHTTDASATLTCSLNGGAFTACGSPFAVVTLYNISSTFSVRARDAAGNTSTITASWTSSSGLVLHYPWEQGQTHNTSLLAQNPAYSPDSTASVPVVGGWAGTAAGQPAAHTYKDTFRPLSSSANGSYTASIWVRVASGSNGGVVMSTLTANNGFQLAISGRQVSLRVNDGGQAFTVNSTVLQNQWVQLGVRTSGPGTGLELLINGSIVGTAAAPTSTGFGAGQAADLTVGTIFGVDLDDLRFYNRGIATSEFCSLLLRGQMNVQGQCIPLMPGFELDFENNQVRDTGRGSLTLLAPNPQLVSFVGTRLGNGLRLNSSDVQFGYTAGFANLVLQAPGHSFSFWFVAGVNTQDTLIDFLRTCAVGAPLQCGIRVTYTTANGLTVIAGNNTPTPITRTIPVANGPHSVVVTEQKVSVDTTQSLTIYVDGVANVMSIGAGNVYANPSDTVILPHLAGTTVDEYEFWPRDLSLDPEMLCENGWDGEWNPASNTCLMTSN